MPTIKALPKLALRLTMLIARYIPWVAIACFVVLGFAKRRHRAWDLSSQFGGTLGFGSVEGLAALSLLDDSNESALNLVKKAAEMQLKSCLLWGETLVAFGELLYPPFEFAFVLLLNHQRELGPVVWAVEIGVLVFVFVCLWLRAFLVRSQLVPRTIQRIINAQNRVVARYTSFIQAIKLKSQAGALILPHVIYWGFIVTPAVALFPGACIKIANPHSIGAVCVMIPAATSAMWLLKPEQADSNLGIIKSLKYWVVFGLAYTAVFALNWLPFVGRFVGQLPLSRVAVFCFSLWLQLPLSGLTTVVEDAAVPSINYIVGKVKTIPFLSIVVSGIGSGNSSRLEDSLNLLHRFGIVSEAVLNYLKEILRNLVTVAITLFALVFPTFGAGPTLVGVICPTISTAQAISTATETQLGSCKRWLMYWTVAAFVLGLRDILSPVLRFVPFWYTFEIVLWAWLQLPVFGGAQAVFGRCCVQVCGWQQKFLGSFKQTPTQTPQQTTPPPPITHNNNSSSSSSNNNNKTTINQHNDTNNDNHDNKENNDTQNKNNSHRNRTVKNMSEQTSGEAQASTSATVNTVSPNLQPADSPNKFTSRKHDKESVRHRGARQISAGDVSLFM